MNHFIGRILGAIPDRWLQKCVHFSAQLVARSNPRDALVALFGMEDSVSGLIDEVAIRYGDGIHPKHRLIGYHEFFIDRILPGDQVLDVGCGRGALANDMARHTEASIIGVDINPEAIDYAKERFHHPRLTFLHADATTYCPPQKVDVVVLSNVLEHLPDRIKFIRNLVDAWKPRALLLRLPMSNRHWTVPLRKELGLRYFNDPTHVTEYTQEQLFRELQEVGILIKEWHINWGEIWASAAIR